MFKSQKHVFWQALIITLVVFSLGIIAGVLLENFRTNQVNSLVVQSELNLLDIRLQNQIYSTTKFNCKMAISENLKFADKTYEEAKTLDRYEKANVITEDLKVAHKKYDLLRSTLLLNSMIIREKCNSSYSEVVYFYQYNNPDMDLKAKESVFSKLLGELKQIKGDSILLIPIAADNNLSSINLLLDKYNVSEEDLPIIIIDGKTRITEIENIDDLKKRIK
ncbi:MAG: hypothetical protein WC979_04620 [Candidatus Pacearchaeota archaeon]|jgi:hypothetical protein